MDNTIKLENKRQLRRVFDLKGSMIKREVKPDNFYGTDERDLFKASTTLKDINYLKLKKVEPGLYNNFNKS